jgi:hypothetical protein
MRDQSEVDRAREGVGKAQGGDACVRRRWTTCCKDYELNEMNDF